jgi:hypothetical protein
MIHKLKALVLATLLHSACAVRIWSLASATCVGGNTAVAASTLTMLKLAATCTLVCVLLLAMAVRIQTQQRWLTAVVSCQHNKVCALHVSRCRHNRYTQRCRDAVVQVSRATCSGCEQVHACTSLITQCFACNVHCVQVVRPFVFVYRRRGVRLHSAA